VDYIAGMTPVGLTLARYREWLLSPTHYAGRPP